MDVTFGILTGAETPNIVDNVNIMINSIEVQDIPNYEILVVGPHDFSHRKNTRTINFNEKIRNLAWITKKKNIITTQAKYDYIVYTHDYLFFHENWYPEWTKWMAWGRSFDIATCGIYTMEGQRHSDWVVSPYDLWKSIPQLKDTWDVLLPYDVTHLTPIMYVSGGWWIAKKSFMEKYPQDENLGWGESEDIEWSKTWRNTANLQCNPNSHVQIMKPGKWAPGFIRPQYVQKMLEAKAKGIIE